MTTGIVVALPEELSTLTSRKIKKGNCIVISENVLAACSGTGPVNAKLAAETLIANGSAQLISWGCAAGLDPFVKPGDLFIPQYVLTQHQKKLPAAPNWHRHAIKTLSQHFTLKTGCLAESDSIISSNKEKADLHKASGCQLVDMESAAVAEISAAAEIPFLAIRTIADSAEMSLPKAVEYALNEEGDIELKQLLGFLAFHPMEIPALIKLAMHFKNARNKLKSVAEFLDIIVCFDKKTAA